MLMPPMTNSNATWHYDSSTPSYDRYYLIHCVMCSEPFLIRDKSQYKCGSVCLSRTCPHCKTQITLCSTKCMPNCEHAIKCLANGCIENFLNLEIKADIIEDPQPYITSTFPPVIGSDFTYTTWVDNKTTSSIQLNPTTTTNDKIVIKA